MSEVTVEVDPEDLSQEVLDELENKANMDSELAEKKADEAYLNNVETKEPNQSTVIDFVKESIKNRNSDLRNLLDEASLIGRIIDVEPKKYNKVVLKIDIGSSVVDFKLKEKSSFLAQLMGYHNVSKITELKNKKIAIDKQESFRNSKDVELLIPKDINLLSNIRYKIYTVQNDIYSKTHTIFRENDDKVFTTVMVSYIISAISGLAFSSSIVGSGIFGIATFTLTAIFGFIASTTFSVLLYLFVSFLIEETIKGSWETTSDTFEI